MRDLGHLEELSSTAALGLWADDVVIAVDQAMSNRSVAEPHKRLLLEAAEMLKDAAERTSHPMGAQRPAYALAATDSALDVASTLVQGDPEEDVQGLLKSMAGLLERASRDELEPEEADSANQVLDLFGALGERQLIASNSVLNSGKESRAWMGAPATSSSS